MRVEMVVVLTALMLAHGACLHGPVLVLATSGRLLRITGWPIQLLAMHCRACYTPAPSNKAAA
jgi:hypothetical protein